MEQLRSTGVQACFRDDRLERKSQWWRLPGKLQLPSPYRGLALAERMRLELSELVASLFKKKSPGLRHTVEVIPCDQLVEPCSTAFTVTSHNKLAWE